MQQRPLGRGSKELHIEKLDERSANLNSPQAFCSGWISRPQGKFVGCPNSSWLNQLAKSSHCLRHRNSRRCSLKHGADVSTVTVVPSTRQLKLLQLSPPNSEAPFQSWGISDQLFWNRLKSVATWYRRAPTIQPECPRSPSDERLLGLHQCFVSTATYPHGQQGAESNHQAVSPQLKRSDLNRVRRRARDCGNYRGVHFR